MQGVLEKKVRFLLLLLVALAICFPAYSQRIIYVKQDAKGNATGESWFNAYTELQDALNQASSLAGNAEIRVAQGIYLPENGQPFHLRSDYGGLSSLKLIGGFGDTLKPPDYLKYPTIISGENEVDILLEADYEESTGYFIEGFRFEKASGSAVYAEAENLSMRKCILSDNRNRSTSSPAGLEFKGDTLSIDSCVFKRNRGKKGSVSFNGKHGTISNCTFQSDSASDGGSLHLIGDTCWIDKCTFSGSEASNSGGAVYGSIKKLYFSRCDFSDCISQGRGGSVFMYNDTCSFEHCTFENSESVEGSGGAIFGSLKVVTFKNDTIKNCSSGDRGGAVSLYAVEIHMDDCRFEENSSTNRGGAISSEVELANINRSIFNNAKSLSGEGGAIYILSDSVLFQNTAFFSCSSAVNGGAMFIGSGGKMDNCTFSDNESGFSGGAVFGSGNDDWPLIASNCTFDDNHAVHGGGWTCDKTSLILDGNTEFINNTATKNGAALYLSGGFDDFKSSHVSYRKNVAVNGGVVYAENAANAYFANCTFDSNSVSGNGGVAHFADYSEIVFNQCLISRNEAKRGGVLFGSDSYNAIVSQCFIDSNKADSGAVSYEWNGKFVNTLFSNNQADSAYVILGTNYPMVGSLSTPAPGPRIINSTLADNKSLYTPAAAYCGDTIVNSIFWNQSPNEMEFCSTPNYSIIRNYSGYGTANSSINPSFTLSGDHPYSLKPSSAAINSGTTEGVDTAGYKFDLIGKKRINLGRIDIGAYEYHDSVTPMPPCILSTLDSIVIDAGSSVTLKLDSLNSNGTGHYVSCTHNDISRIVWSFNPQPYSMQVLFNPQTSSVTLTPDLSYRPGVTFSISAQAADPDNPDLSGKKSVKVIIANPGFDVCSYTLSQNDSSRIFSGSFETMRNVEPMRFSQNRVYLFDSLSPNTDELQFLSGISVQEITKPVSRGGNRECGVYSFSFNATDARVYNADGSWTGKTLYQWATDSISGFSGSEYYRINKKIRFLLPITNVYDRVHETIVDVAADFDGPYTTMQIANHVYSQNVTWNNFKKPLSSLILYRIPQGTDSPSIDTIALSVDQVSYESDSLQDSRTYMYLLEATDIKGNSAVSQVAGKTHSGQYSITGKVNGINAPPGTMATLRLIDFNSQLKPELIADTTVAADSSYQFQNVTNGRYIIAASADNGMNAQPYKEIFEVLRSDKTYDFTLSHSSPIKPNGVTVKQEENTGDLLFTAETDTLYYDEKPTSVLLRWEGGKESVDSASQAFKIGQYTQTTNSDGTAQWKFTITREQIQDSILSRGKHGFDYNTRYINSELHTEGVGYSSFRSGNWSYPVPGDSARMILFSPQVFKNPAEPFVSNPLMSADDARFLLYANTNGTGLKAYTELDEKRGFHTVKDTFDVADVSAQDSDGWIVRRLDWNTMYDASGGGTGRAFVSGLIINSSSQGEESSVEPISTFHSSPYSPDWSNKDTVPFASWKIRSKKNGNYNIWFFLEDTLSQSAELNLIIDSHNNTETYQGRLEKGTVPGWHLFHAKPLFKSYHDITVSLVSDKQLPLSAFACNLSDQKPDETLKNKALSYGKYGRIAFAGGFSLGSDNVYDLKAFIKDRFGNCSDTVHFDSLITKSDYFKGNISINQQPSSGDLVLDIITKDSAATHLDSVIFKFDNEDYPVYLNAALNRGGHTEITIPRDKLGSAASLPSFQRHTIYDSLLLVFAAESTYTLTQMHEIPVESCSECDSTCNPSTQSRWIIPPFWKEETVTRTCKYSTSTTHKEIIRTAIMTSWPDGTGSEVASQEYRSVTDPNLDTASVTSRTVALVCNNLDSLSAGTRKQQLSGNLKIKWEPGSECQDSSVVDIPFGNRFTMHNSWIAFSPSFEGAIETNPGMWREQDTLGAVHQWIDYVDSNGSDIGGLFYPQIGVSIPEAAFPSSGSTMWPVGSRRTLPYLSMGIRLTEDQESQDTTSEDEKFHLWVMPSRNNGTSSSKFYWGVDGNPIGPDTADTAPLTWRKGPDVYLSAGDHTIDIYMIDDGMGIAGVALSKEDGPPSISAGELSRWGDAGFNLRHNANNLPHSTDIKFTAVATDRMGNTSGVVEKVFTTRTVPNPVPGVAITPHVPLENGFYPSVYPGFDLSLESEVTDTLSLEVKLKKIENGTSVDLLTPDTLSIEKNIWSVQVDSASPLIEYPTDSILSPNNCYALYARAKRTDAVPDSSNWSRVLFGVRYDSSGVPPSVVILDPLYEVPDLKFRYLRGIETGPATILGDMEVLFDFDNEQNSTSKLVAENVTIYTDTVTDSAGFNHLGISDISLNDIRFASYECDVFGENCTSVPVYNFPYGRHLIETSADSLELVQDGADLKLASGSTYIIDDAQGKARASGDMNQQTEVLITRKGIIDTFHVAEDFFFLQDVVKFSSYHPGFNIRGCQTTFARNYVDPDTDTFTIRAAGDCDNCGPFLTFSVLSPAYMDLEFDSDEKMRDPMVIRYTKADQTYTPDFGALGYNSVDNSNMKNVAYRSWPISINSYQFRPEGVLLTDFDIQPNTDIFPSEKNSDTHLRGFSGVLIAGQPDFNDGALHFAGRGKVTNPGVKLTTSRDYLFMEMDSITFEPVEGGRSYVLNLGHGTELALPTWTDAAQEVYSNSPQDSIFNSVNEFILGTDDIRQFRAEGDFYREIGNIYVNSDFDQSLDLGSLSTGEPGLKIDGTSRVTYAARDFQLNISPADDRPLFRLGRDFFTHGREDSIDNGSIGLFSDLTINTLYAKQIFDEERIIAPPGYEKYLSIPSRGIDVVNTNNGVRVMLLSPQLDISVLGESQNRKYVDIYNASFDLDRKLTSLNGRIPIPEDNRALSKLNDVIGKVATVDLEEIYLGYSKNTPDGEKLTIGADANLTFGSAFRNIGLADQRISLDELSVGYLPNQKQVHLEELHARAFPLPMRLGIGPDDFTSSPVSNGKDYVELISGGNGIKVDYSRTDRLLSLDMSNWTIRLTQDFPFEPLRNLSFVLDTMLYERGESGGDIKALSARAEWSPPDGMLQYEDFIMKNVKVSLGCKSDTISGNDGSEIKNKTDIDGFFKFEFDTLVLNEEPYDTKGELYVFFDGRVAFNTTITFTDTIPIVPWKAPSNPEVYIDPGVEGTDVTVSFDSEVGLDLAMRNVMLRSRDVIAALDERLAVDVDTLQFGFENGSPVLKELDVSYNTEKEIMDNTAFTLKTKSVGVRYSDSDSLFEIDFESDLEFNLGKACSSSCQPILKASYRVHGSDDFKLDWDVPCWLECELAGFGLEAQLKISGDTIGFETALIDMSALQDLEIFKGKDEPGDKPVHTNLNFGIQVTKAYWVRDSSGWKHPDSDVMKVIPTFNIDAGVDIVGVGVKGKIDFTRLFQENPGIGFRDISVKMNKALGGKEFPTGFSVVIDNKAPYIHPEWERPQKLVLEIPSISLGDNFTLGSALMELGTAYDSLYGYETWYFRGKASMSMGVVDPVEVDLALEKPHPWQNVTGIRHAKVTVNLKGARIPIGTTPFYITGFFGALYDGTGMPEGAVACGINNLPPGLKMEAAVFIEFEESEMANGRVGFWAHLRTINFGINGEIKALKGVVDADACVALYNNGRAFHGNFLVTAEMKLAMQGRFVVDIWSDETGGNFTADAQAKIGIKRGTLVKSWLLKVPSRTRWFGLHTRMGKFSNQQNGFTTGLKFFGKTWGLGVIGRKFRIGNMGKYKLKPAPLVRTLSKIRAVAASDEQYDYKSLGLKLEGGEVISVVAASDSGAFEWPENALCIASIVRSGVYDIEDDRGHYLPQDESVYGSYTEHGYYEHLNTISRTWYNDPSYDIDSVALVLPKRTTEEEKFEYAVMAGLLPPVCSLHVRKEVNADNDTNVVFSGTVRNFQASVRSLVQDTTGSSPDTLLKQMMRLQFYSASEYAQPSDSDLVSYGYKKIPINQFAGYDNSSTSLLDNSSVVWVDSNKVLHVNDLTWNSSQASSGTYQFFAAPELLDFITQDEYGNKHILSDTAVDSAMVVRDNPIRLYRSTNDSSLITVTVEKEALPISRIAGFTATGSAVSSNLAEEDETRTLFLRWKKDDNPSLAGYKIKWFPTGMPEAGKETVIGAVNRYKVEIPVLDQFYAEDCADAAGGNDTSGYARSCSSAVKDPAYYTSTQFTFVISPFAYRDTTIMEKRWDSSAVCNDCEPKEVAVRTKYMLVQPELGDTAEAELGVNSGVSDKNDLAVAFSKNGSFLQSGDTVTVTLNETGVLKTHILASRLDTSSTDPSFYGETYAVVTGYNGDTIPSELETSLPVSGLNDVWFDIADDTITKKLLFSPSQKDLLCAEMFSFPCSSSTDCGCEESECDPAIGNCDPNASSNSRPTLDPCNGNPDALIRGRSPFGTYKARVYAINNGRRAVPVENGTAGSGCVYDSVYFRIMPPQPLLHSVTPDYLRDQARIYEDTLRLRVSGLWLEDGDTPCVKLAWPGDSSTFTNYELKALGKGSMDSLASVDSITSAEYEILLPVTSLPGNLTDGERIRVSVVNLTDTDSVQSNEVEITWLADFYSLQCPDEPYSGDNVNAEYSMDFIGVYPKSPRVCPDNAALNDSVTFYFTRFYSHKNDSIRVKIHQNGRSEEVFDYVLNDAGLKFKLPSWIEPNDETEYKMNFKGYVSKCEIQEWSSQSKTSLKAEYDIPSSDGTVTLEPINGGDVSADRVQYFVGLDPVVWPVQAAKPYRVYPASEPITLSTSNWVTFIITDKDGGNPQIIRKWVDVQKPAVLTDAEGNVLPERFVVRSPDTLKIKPPANPDPKRDDPIVSYCWRFANGETNCGNTIVIKPGFECPLTVETWYTVADTGSGSRKIRGPVSTYCPEIITPTELIAIRLPSANVLRATTDLVENYPVRLKIDTSIADWPVLASDSFYFVNRELVPLAHEIDNRSEQTHSVDVWIKLDKIDPGAPDNVIYLVTGDSSLLPAQSVWSDFSAVYHCSSDSLLEDATGNGFTIPSAGAGTLSDGVVGKGYRAAANLAVGSAGETVIDNNSPGISFSAWFKLDSAQTIPTRGIELFSYVDRYNNETVSLSVMPDLSLAFFMGNDTLRSMRGTVEKGVWLHTGFAYGWYNSDATARIFVNGIRVAQKLMNDGNDPEIDSKGTFYLAGAPLEQTTFGTLDEVRVTTSVLSDSWFRLDYLTQRKRNDFLRLSSFASEIVSLSSPECRLKSVESRMSCYTDKKNLKLLTLPAQYQSATMVTRPYTMNGISADTLFTVGVSGAASVVVLADTGCGKPEFLDDFQTRGNAQIRDTITGTISSMVIFEKFLDSSAVVSFGSMSESCSGNRSNGYVVLFDLYETKGAINVASSDYGTEIKPFASDGDLLFSDREYTLDQLPPHLEQSVLVTTPNAFKHDTSSSFVTLSFDRKAKVYCFVDSTDHPAPDFLNTWTGESETLHSGTAAFRLFSRTVDQQSITVPGPGTGSGNNRHSYGFMVKKGDDGCLVEQVHPYSCNALCAGADTGTVLYTDSSWVINRISEGLRNRILVQTAQADFRNRDSSYVSFHLQKNAWVYCAVDSAQKKMPSFMNDLSDGAWSYTGYTLGNSDGGEYEVWRKFHKAGRVTFAGVRSDGEQNNGYNYLFFVDRHEPETDWFGDSLIYPFAEGDNPFSDINKVTVSRLPRELDSLAVNPVPFQPEGCDTVRFVSPTSVKVYLAVPPDYALRGTFLETEGWTSTDFSIGFSRVFPDYRVYSKLFPKGLVAVPGLQCGNHSHVQFNYVMFIDALEIPVQGYNARSLAVRGIGGERLAESQSLIMRNLDISYAMEMNMESRSYRMNISLTGGRAEAGDTLNVLALKDTSVVTTENGDSTAVVANDTLSLPDLMPALLNADSVEVNALDLTSRGAVRVIFTNKSDVTVNSQFTVILFEDNNGDYQFSSTVDTYLGRAYVDGIGPNEYKVYEIPLEDNQAFPNRTMFAFVDANQWVRELDEWNNIKSSGTTCDGFERELHTVTSSDTGVMLPEFRDTAVYCHLMDTDGDSSINYSDSLCVVYTYDNRLYAVNSVTQDTLFPSVEIDPLVGMKVKVEDFTGDGVPEIISGNKVFSNMGELLFDFTTFSTSVSTHADTGFDFNRDGERDSVAFVDSCVTVWSGHDSTLLYVNPFSRWTGGQNAVTTDVLADIKEESFYCYDFNVSFPRYSAVQSDTADLTIRIGNAGAAPSNDRGVKVAVFADTATVFDTSATSIPSSALMIGEKRSGKLLSGQYEDLKFTAALPAETKRIWFRSDAENYYFECNERDGVVYFGVE